MSLTNSPFWMSSVGGDFYGKEIDNSLRFNDNDSAYLNRTPASSGTTGTWTLSVWVKRANLTNGVIFSSGAVNQRGHVYFSSDKLAVQPFNSTGANAYLESDMLFRDVNAWYHIVIKANAITYANLSTNMDIYVNGEEITHTKYQTSTPTGGDRINDGQVKVIGQYAPAGSGTFFDGYLSEYHFIDGTALDASSFGENKSGIWIPKAYSGSYGTNGFHLDFGSSAALGTDVSGNANNFTVNNLSSYDQMPDTPTNNFATMNSVDNSTSGTYTFTQGNLVTQAPGTNWVATRASMFVSSGKWYWECRFNAGLMTEIMNGISDVSVANTTNIWTQAGNVFFYNHIGGEIRYNSGTDTNNNYGTLVAGDILGVALDMDAKTISFYKNGSIIVNSFSINYTNVDNVAPVGVSDYSNVIYAWNFGQDSTFAGLETAGGNADENGYGDFKYSVPSGYLALCSANLPDPAIDPANDDTPTDYFDTVLYTAASSNGTYNIGNASFVPDFTWIKNRDNVEEHYLFDVVRGNSSMTNKFLRSNSTAAEGAGGVSGTTVTSQLGGMQVVESSINSGELYFNSRTYVMWNWKAGGTGVSNTDGSITSTVSANTDAGFSVVTYTGNGTNTSTIGHGLSSAPEFVIVKSRSNSRNWVVEHNQGKGMYLNLTNDGASAGSNTMTQQASTIRFDVSNDSNRSVNFSGETYVAYCFHSVDGFSKIGSYIGNGSSDGSFVYTGFRPAWVVIKRYDSSNNWNSHDNKRGPYNVNDWRLYLNLVSTEDSGGSYGVDFLSNGFKVRTSEAGWNASGGTYIYLVFAEQPFKYANAR